MKKLNIKKKFFALMLGLIFGCATLPLTALSNINKSMATGHPSAYITAETIDISGDFEEDSSNWTFYSYYSNHLNSDSTSFNEIKSIDSTDWDNSYADFIENFISTWSSTLEKENVSNDIKTELEALKPTVPTDHNSASEGNILVLSAGYTYSIDTPPYTKTNRYAYVKAQSKNITLNAYSFYKISVYVKTIDGATASIKFGGDKEETVFNSITSSSTWQQYTIYISTVNKTTFNLGLCLGNSSVYSTDSVYFDDAKVEQIEEYTFLNAIENSTTKIYDYREILTINNNNASSRNYKTLQDFETSNNWTIVPSSTGLDGIEMTLEDEKDVSTYSDTFFATDSTNTVLKVDNYGNVSKTLKSAEMQIKQFRYYRIAVWAMSTNSSASLKVSLVGTMNSKDVSVKDETSPYNETERTAETPSSITNFWVEYAFYVKGSSLYDTTCYITTGIGASNVIFFDNLTIEYITETEYNAQTSNLLDLSSSASTSNITNGYFNNYDTINYNEYASLLPPTNWTSEKTETIYALYDINGIFEKAYLKTSSDLTINDSTIILDSKTYTQDSTNTNHFNYYENAILVNQLEKIDNVVFSYTPSKSAYYNTTYKLGISTNVSAGIVSGYNNSSISTHGYTENALKMLTTTADSLTYKSSSISLTSTSSLYRISVEIKTIGSATANLKITNKDNVVYGEQSNISSTTWKTFTFLVATGNETIDLYLNLTLENSIGEVYFKNVSYTTTKTLTSLETNNSKNSTELVSDGIMIIDLSKETFIEHKSAINSETKLFNTELYKTVEQEGKTAGIVGVLDTENADSLYSSITAKDNTKSPYVLIIQNAVNQSTKIDALKKFTLNSGSAYKITITAKTLGLDENKSATVLFNSLNKQFNISSSDYKTYTLYVDATDADSATTLNYTLSLLDTQGTFIIDSIAIETENDIDSIKKEYENDTEFVIITTIESGEEESTETDTTKNNTEDNDIEKESNTLEILFAIFSSLLLVGAIIFAVVFLRVKSTAKTTKPRKKNKVTSSENERGFV